MAKADQHPAPHDLDLERSLLGALLTDADRALETMNGTADADLFYKPAHGHIFTAATSIANAGGYVDIGVVRDRLRTDGLLDHVGGESGLLDACLLEHAPPPEAAGQFADRLAELRRQRRLITAADEARRAALDGDTDSAARRLLHALDHDTPTRRNGPAPVQWDAFWQRERHGSDWAWEPVLPRGKATNLYAPRGLGKSELALYGAAALATGRGPLNTAAGEPLSVVYLDLEMGEDDLEDRLTGLGYGPGDDLSALHYFVLTDLPPMTTVEGGVAVLEIASAHDAEVVIVDTLARVGGGEENSNDTWIGLGTHTVLRLKARGITSLWLGHAGKDITKGERGGSAKGDTVDCIWRQERGDQGAVRLVNEKRRSGWVPETVDLVRVERGGRLAYQMGTDTWPAGTNAVVADLEQLGAPAQITRRAASALLRENGMGARDQIVSAALRWRRLHPEGLTTRATQEEF